MGTVVLKGNAVLENPNGSKINCEVRGKSFVLDEPEKLGGTDLGMNPLEAFLSSLAACKCIITKSAAQKFGIELEALSVDCSGVLDPDGLNDRDPNARVGLSSIESIYKIRSSASSEALKKLIAYVDVHCPVHKTVLESPALSSVLQQL